MNRMLATPLVMLLGLMAFDAVAQERGRGGGAREEVQHRAQAGDNGGGRGSYSDSDDKRGGDGYRGGGGRGNSGADGRRGGGDDHRASYGVQAAPARHGGDGRDGYRNSYGSQGNQNYSPRGDGRDNRGRDDGRHGDKGYNNAYGYQDYRRGLPRTDGRDYRNDSRGRDYRHHDGRHDYRVDYRYSRPSNGWRDNDWRRSWNHGWSGKRYHVSTRYYYPRGYSARRWAVGYLLPLAFLSSSYYVDYRPYGLAAPPYGTRWLRVDGDLLLVDVDTGEVVDILYGFYY